MRTRFAVSISGIHPDQILGLSKLLDTTFQIGGEDILQLFTRLTGRWVLALRESLNNIDDVQVCYAFAHRGSS